MTAAVAIQMPLSADGPGGANGGPVGLSVPTVEEQTGWTRPYCRTICQELDVVIRVTEYDFDLENAEFREYADRRGVLFKAGVGKRFAFTKNHAATKAEFFREFRFSKKGVRFSDDDMEFHWRIMLAAKGYMQDAWELFLVEKQDGRFFCPLDSFSR